MDYVNSSDIGDGYYERWYNLVWGTIDKGTTPNTYNPTTMYHIDNDIITIYYQFQNTGRDSLRSAKPTNYAYARGLVENTYWVLHSDLRYMTSGGNIRGFHNDLEDYEGVRPAITILK